MFRGRSKRAACFIAITCVAAGRADVSREVTREFAVGQTFEVHRAGPFKPAFHEFDIRWKVIAVDGQLELCGAMIVRDLNARDRYRDMLRRATLLVDGEPVLRDLSYFNTSARSFAPFTTDVAACRAIGLPIPTQPITTELRLNAHLVKNPD